MLTPSSFAAIRLVVFPPGVELLPTVDELFPSGEETLSAAGERSTTITETHLLYLSASVATSFLLVAAPGGLVLAVDGEGVLGARLDGDRGDWRESEEFFPAKTGIFEELSSLLGTRLGVTGLGSFCCLEGVIFSFGVCFLDT